MKTIINITGATINAGLAIYAGFGALYVAALTCQLVIGIIKLRILSI